ncbi:hypothetical protein [Bdellovibrio svalbardensis]|uniref:Lipoprotein n=1 Tax=Bdellovibrio svalbardensis TaxID=2972972 RepID=A0ABT6DJU7_9BACT|nr:hypothetical protein [Bdellovibrio svalbardensis]MDG0817125.1 hypothetical protein [Bdellovibrio svalbardensis]
MKKMIKSIALCTSLLATLSACSPEKTKEVTKVQLSVNEQMQSDELTAAGEQLIAPHTFHLADRAFALALEKNPSDKKAEFYRVFLKRFMVFRGVMTNIKPMVKKYGDAAKYDKEMKKIPNSPINDFLFMPADGVIKPINTEEDVQNLLIAYRNALQDFRTYVAMNQDLKLELHVNPIIFMNQINENMTSNCTVVPGTKEEDGQIECDTSEIATVRVNIADLLSLKQEAAGEILYLALYTSYNFNGLAQYTKDNSGKEMTAKESYDLLQSKVDFKLLKNEGFTAIRSLGADLGVAAKWAMKYQDSICPKDKNGMPVARKGYMFKKGLCIDNASNLEKNLALLEQVLKGTMAVKIGSDEANQITKNINFLAPFDKPVADLRMLTPATWNEAGTQGTSFKDKTLGGMFPDQDADFLLQQTK